MDNMLNSSTFETRDSKGEWTRGDSCLVREVGGNIEELHLFFGVKKHSLSFIFSHSSDIEDLIGNSEIVPYSSLSDLEHLPSLINKVRYFTGKLEEGRLSEDDVLFWREDCATYGGRGIEFLKQSNEYVRYFMENKDISNENMHYLINTMLPVLVINGRVKIVEVSKSPVAKPQLLVNVNHNVKVKLTDRGVAFLKENNAKYGGGYRDSKIDSDGYYETQLWELMSTFGPKLGMGSPLLFETEIIVTGKKI